MNKQEFLKTFRSAKAQHPIIMIFNDDVFQNDDNVSLIEEEVSLEEVLEYFVPKFEKDGHLDMRGIHEQVADPNVLPLTVSKASSDPARWGLSLDTIPAVESLSLIPVATDLTTGRSLILDSNHTIVSLVSKLAPESLSSLKISVVRILGNGLDSLSIDDFKIINRQ